MDVPKMWQNERLQKKKKIIIIIITTSAVE
jgi:hypothetical protein